MESPPWETNVQQIALNNPIILTQILQQDCIPLKTCRLVCHSWNDIVLSSLPNTRLALQLTRKNPFSDEKKLFQFDSQEDDDDEDAGPVPFLALCFTLDGRLAKRICATATCSSSDFVSKLLHVCDKFSQRVQILEISTPSDECLPGIYHILKNCCPALTQLRISVVTKMKLSTWYNVPQIGFHPLQLKPNLVKFEVSAPVNGETEFLAQLVVNAAPNLSEVTIPVGFCVDFGNSLDSLTIGFRGMEDVDDLSTVSKMLEQVGDQLVTLCFVGNAEMKSTDRVEFFLEGRKLPNLRNFRNQMVDVFRCDALFKNIVEKMPSLSRMEIGGRFKGEARVDEILQDLISSGQVVGSVTNLVLIGVQDPILLDGLGAVFPNVVRLEVTTKGEIPWGKVDPVLQACGGWRGLKQLKLGLSTNPGSVIGDLLENRDLFKGKLKTLEIRLIKRMYHPSQNLTQDEFDLLTKLLMEMDGMDEVLISSLYFSRESRRNVLDFMISNKLEVSKFKMFQGGKPCRAGD